MSKEVIRSLVSSQLYKQHNPLKGATKPSDVITAEWSPLAKKELQKTANMLGVSENDLLAIIAHETGGSFNPAQRVFGVQDADDAAKKGLTGTGLIQFINRTAKSLLEKYHGKEVAQKMLAAAGNRGDVLFERMSPETQLIFVREYFADVADKIKKLPPDQRAGAAYAYIFTGHLPPDNTEKAFAVKGSQAYEANSGLDKDKDGEITYREIMSGYKGSVGKQPAFRAKMESVPADYLEHVKDKEELKKLVVDMLKSGELQPLFGTESLKKALPSMHEDIVGQSNKQKAQKLIDIIEKGQQDERDLVMRWLLGQQPSEKDIQPILQRYDKQEAEAMNKQQQAAIPVTNVNLKLNKKEAKQVKKRLIDRIIDFFKFFD